MGAKLGLKDYTMRWGKRGRGGGNTPGEVFKPPPKRFGVGGYLAQKTNKGGPRWVTTKTHWGLEKMGKQPCGGGPTITPRSGDTPTAS